MERSRRVIKWAMVVVILLALTKGSIGYFSGSVGLFAQAIDSFTDLIAGSTVYLGLWLAQRSPSQKYPYGYFKAETMAALIVAIFIFGTGLLVLWQAILHILLPIEIVFYDIALIVATISVPIIFVKSWYLKKVGRETGSEAVSSVGQDYRMDFYASFVVLIGLVFEGIGIWWAEAVVGFFIGLVILKSSLEISYNSVLVLMDAVTNPEQVEEIEKLASNVRGVQGIHDIKVRHAGPICFGEMHIEVAADLSLSQAYRVSEEIERRVTATFPEMLTFLVHLEPTRIESFRIAIPVNKANSTPESLPNPNFETAPYFLLIDVKHGDLFHSKTMKNPGSSQNKQRGINSAKAILHVNANVLLAGGVGETPFNILRNALIDIHCINLDQTCLDNVRAFLDNKLPHLIALSKDEKAKNASDDESTKRV
ncbi:MAG: cation diffusion facilitator family transporter [Promethearchaeota archaeon]